MKRKRIVSLIALLLAVCTLFTACGGKTETPESEEPAMDKPDTVATEADIAKLDAAYVGMQAHHGQLHDHAKTGRKSDGKATLQEWIAAMPDLGMEFAIIVDHRQTDHLYHELWDPNLFIGGTEVGSIVSDRPEHSQKYHYNIIFPNVTEMEGHLSKFLLEYKFVDGLTADGYAYMPASRFIEIMDDVLERGGMFVLPHPMQTTPADDVQKSPLDYYFRDFIYYEVLYDYYSDRQKQIKAYEDNYWLYTGLLAEGKRVYTSAACDRHMAPSNRGLSTVYSKEATGTSYLEQLHVGNVTAGPVGVKMVIGDTVMGGTGSFENQRIVFSVGDFHKDFKCQYDTFRVDLLSDTGVVFSETIDPSQTTTFAFDADPNARFYRVEVHNESLDYTLLAMGNPIWNSAKYEG